MLVAPFELDRKTNSFNVWKIHIRLRETLPAQSKQSNNSLSCENILPHAHIALF